MDTFLLGSFILVLIFLFSLLNPKAIIKKRVSTVFRGYELFYSDQRTDKKLDGVIYSKLLVSEKYGIKGKPDYIFKRKSGNMLLPAELKSGTVGDRNFPRENDLMQLVMYFLIIEDVYGIKPREGRLIYKDCMFLVRNTAALRRKLKSVLKDMRDMLKTGEQQAYPGFAKCKHCMCRGTVCEYCEV